MYAVPKPSKTRKESRPSRDEFELQELVEKLVEGKENNAQLNFTIWRKTETVQGVVIRMEPGTQMVHIQTKYDGVLKIPFIDILRVENVE